MDGRARTGRPRPAQPSIARLAAGLAALLWAIALVLASLAAPTVPAHGAVPPPAAPLLVVVSAASTNPFGGYLGEILRAEGFNSFQTSDLADLTDPYLASFPFVLLAEMPLSDAQANQDPASPQIKGSQRRSRC